jgi:hypothetical protein
MALRKSYEVVGWTHNGTLYCVDHEPGLSNTDISIPQPVFLDQITQYDVCDLCFIPLDA